MALDNTVGAVNVKVTVDSSTVGPALNEVKNKTTSATEEMAGGFKKAVSSVTSFVAALGAAAGVAVTFYNIGKKINDILDDQAIKLEKLEKLRKERQSNEARDLAKTASTELERLQTELGDIEQTLGFDSLIGAIAPAALEALKRRRDTTKKLIEENEKDSLVSNQRITKASVDAERKARQEAADKEWDDSVEQSQKALDDAAILGRKIRDEAAVNADEERRLTAEYNADVIRGNKKNADDTKDALDKELELIRRNGEARIRYAQQYADALRRIQGEQSAGFGSGDVTFGNIGAAVQRIEAAVRSIQNRPTGMN